MESNKEIISRLKFIGKIQKGDKVNVKYMYVQPNSIVTQLSRSFINFDNRSNTLSFVDSTINRAFEIISIYEISSKKSDQALCKNIIIDLINCKKGLQNLKNTYNSDIKFCCDIDALLQFIEAKLIEINHLIPSSDEDSGGGGSIELEVETIETD